MPILVVMHYAPLRVQLLAAFTAFAVLLPLPFLALLGLSQPWRTIAFVASALLIAAAVVRSFRIAFAIDADGLDVVNYFVRTRISWPEVRKVRLGDSLLVEGVTQGILLERRQGRSVLVQASLTAGKLRRGMLEELRQHGTRWGVEADVPENAVRPDALERLMSRVSMADHERDNS